MFLLQRINQLVLVRSPLVAIVNRPSTKHGKVKYLRIYMSYACGMYSNNELGVE